MYPESKTQHDRWVECKSEVLARLNARTSSAGEVETALAELREVFPKIYVRVRRSTWSHGVGHHYQGYDITLGLENGGQNFGGTTLAEAMDNARAWKEGNDAK